MSFIKTQIQKFNKVKPDSHKLVIDLNYGCILSILYSTRSQTTLDIHKVFQKIKSTYDCKLKNSNEICINIKYGVVRVCKSGLIQFFVSKEVLYFITFKEVLAKKFLKNIGINVNSSVRKGQIIYKKKSVDNKLGFIKELIKTFPDIKPYIKESHDLESVFIPVSLEQIPLCSKQLIFRFIHQSFVLTITTSGCLNLLCYKFKTLSIITNLFSVKGD